MPALTWASLGILGLGNVAWSLLIVLLQSAVISAITFRSALNAGVSDGREEYRLIGSIGADLYVVLIGQRAIAAPHEMVVQVPSWVQVRIHLIQTQGQYSQCLQRTLSTSPWSVTVKASASSSSRSRDKAKQRKPAPATETVMRSAGVSVPLPRFHSSPVACNAEAMTPSIGSLTTPL
jgi:hypothetical protein